MEQSKTSLGLEPNVAGLLCYLFFWVTGLIFFLVEKDNRFVRFHAMQSIIVFGALTVLSIMVSALQKLFITILGIGRGMFTLSSLFNGLLGLISTIIGIATVILWILLMIKAYQNEAFKLPIAGDIAERQVQ